MKQAKITEHLTVKKKRDRFNGMPEEDVAKRTLPDHLAENLDIVIVGLPDNIHFTFDANGSCKLLINYLKVHSNQL